MNALRTLLQRLARRILRRPSWRRFDFDLEDLTLDDQEIYFDLAAGRD